MKQTTTLLALAFGLSALSTFAQSQGDQAKQLKEAPARRDDARMDRDERRDQDARPRRLQRRDQAGPRQMNRAPGSRHGRQQGFAPGRRGFGPQQQFDPGPRGFGPQRQFGPGPQGFGMQRRGPAWDGPQAGPGNRFGGPPQMSPRRNWSPKSGTAPGWHGRGGQGFGDRQNFGPRQRNAGPRQDFGPRQRGFGPQGRGPAFGPPPWAGRGGSDNDMRPGPRGQRPEAPPMQGRGFGPLRRGPGVPDAPTDRMDRPDAGPRGDERDPRNAPPVDSDDR